MCEFSEPKKKAKYAPPPVLHRDVDRQFCGGGAWISGSDEGEFWEATFSRVTYSVASCTGKKPIL